MSRRAAGYHPRQPARTRRRIRRRVDDDHASPRQTRRRWAALIKHVWKVDPLVCPRCGRRLKIISFPHARRPPMTALRPANRILVSSATSATWGSSTNLPPPSRPGPRTERDATLTLHRRPARARSVRQDLIPPGHPDPPDRRFRLDPAALGPRHASGRPRASPAPSARALRMPPTMPPDRHAEIEWPISHRVGIDEVRVFVTVHLAVGRGHPRPSRFTSDAKTRCEGRESISALDAPTLFRFKEDQADRLVIALLDRQDLEFVLRARIKKLRRYADAQGLG